MSAYVCRYMHNAMCTHTYIFHNHVLVPAELSESSEQAELSSSLCRYVALISWEIRLMAFGSYLLFFWLNESCSVCIAALASV